MKVNTVLKSNKTCIRWHSPVELFLCWGGKAGSPYAAVLGFLLRARSVHTVRTSHSALYSTHFDGSVGKCFWQIVINLFSP